MSNMYEDVKEFHRLFGLNIGTTPEFPNKDERNLRLSLLLEEVKEYVESEEENDFVNLAKEMSDIIYIVCGTAVSYGIPLDKVFDEVHKSNLSKLVDGKAIRREDGKVLKGPNYVPPDIKKVLYG